MKKGMVGTILTIAALWSGQSLAQTGALVNDTDYLSKETENPVTRQTTLPLRCEADFLDGADKLTKSTIELDQAVVPFRLNDDWSLITRTKLPAEVLPPKNAAPTARRIFDDLCKTTFATVSGVKPTLHGWTDSVDLDPKRTMRPRE